MKSAAKKTISLMLTLLMVLGMVYAVPATVWAAGNIKLEAGADQSGTGWSWNGSSNTLTLSGANLGAVEIVP